MKIIRDIKYLRTIIGEIKSKNQLLGFVPTMGSLHSGHISLLNESINENDVTICSIYVNPTQFNDPVDFAKYPREYNSDLELLQSLDCDIVFLPTDEAMYPENHKPIDYEFSNYMNILEGEKRPGHFLGVVTIIHKFFRIIHPDRAYFGEKDYQQLWLIRLFAKKFQIPTEIKACKTIRNKNGLALSSRNKHLTEQQKAHAQSLFLALDSLKCAIKGKSYLNNKNFIDLKDQVFSQFLSSSWIKLDYFDVIEDESFRFVREIKHDKKYRILIAAYVGGIRLIDNMLIE